MPRFLQGAAAVFARRQLGGDVGETEAVESIGTTASKVLDNDPERVTALLVNMSANTIYLAFDEAVSSTRGIILAANGGTLITSVRDDFMLPTHSFWAVASAAASNLYVLTSRRIGTLESEGAEG
jgi:hypothetical protein